MPTQYLGKPLRIDFRFVKYHGCGNDFVLRDEMESSATPDGIRSEIAKRLCDRHFGIGADGVMFIESVESADGSMRLFEPAGNEADMCGNGLRCAAAFLMEKLSKDRVLVMTRDGVKPVERVEGKYRASMGLVRTSRGDLVKYLADRGLPSDSLLDFPLEVGGRKLDAAFVNTGEPHVVIVAEDASSSDIVALGKAVNSRTDRFPTNTNVNVLEVNGPHEISIRTYERGVFDETLACGTGATACAAVSVLRGLVKPGKVRVRTKGGVLEVEIGPDGNAYMTGPAERVFEGRLELEV